MIDCSILDAQGKAMLMDLYTNNVRKERGRGPTRPLQKHIEGLLRRCCRVTRALVKTVLPPVRTKDAWLPAGPDPTPPPLPQHSAWTEPPFQSSENWQVFLHKSEASKSLPSLSQTTSLTQAQGSPHLSGIPDSRASWEVSEPAQPNSPTLPRSG